MYAERKKTAQTKNKVIELLHSACALEEQITEKTKLRELSTDSLSFIEFLVRVEETFNIEFEAEELDINVWETVGDIIKAVGVKTNETGFKGAESV